MNMRLLLAVVLSTLVMVAFTHFMPQKAVSVESNTTKTESKVTEKESAPKAPVEEVKKAPVENKAAPVTEKKEAKIIATVQTKKYTLKIDSLGRIDSVILKEKKYKTSDNKPLDIINKNTVKPLEVRFKNADLNRLAFGTDYTASEKAVDASNGIKELILEQDLGSVKLKKTFKFYPEGNYDLKVEAGDKEYYITPGFRPTADKSRYLVVRGVLVYSADGISKTFEKGDVDKQQSFNNAEIVAAEDRYYTSLLMKKKGQFTTFITESGLKDYQKEPIAFIDIKGSENFLGYVGPKEWKLFASIDKRLENVIEFGWFTFLSRPFFKVMFSIYNFVGNWGWAIVLFTILVKLVLFPLSYKGLMSMQKMKDLAPKMKELKEKYGKDPAKMNQQMMQLYKKHGANPMGGCLPMLLQVPIFFALYRVLLNADELQGAPWIAWITDLSRQDPYYVLPILMGITMFIQQKVTPNTVTDPTQQKIFQFLPIIMTFFFLTFPSGLVLYWLVNNILTIAQQYYINKAYEKYKLKMKAQKNTES